MSMLSLEPDVLLNRSRPVLRRPPMRILNIIQCTNLGGMEQASLRLMQALLERGHRCRVLSLNPLGALGPALAAAGIPAIGLPYRGALGWRSFPALYRQIRRERADALIMTGSNLLAMIALGRLCEGHRMLAVHFHHAVRPDWQWRLFYRLAQKRFTAISYPSDYVRLEAEALVPDIQPIARTVRNPLFPPDPATADAQRQARASLSLPPDAILVGNAGWLIERKRFDVFLRTAAIIARQEPRAAFVIAGEGPALPQLSSLAESLGIAHRIHWLGWVRAMETFYRSIDLLLFNSDWDALGNTPIEALSHGVPVVASVLHGGLKEYLTDSRYGILLDDHDPERLAAEALRCLSGAGRAIATAGRSRVLAMSEPDAIATEVENLLVGRAAPTSASTASARS